MSLSKNPLEANTPKLEMTDKESYDLELIKDYELSNKELTQELKSYLEKKPEGKKLLKQYKDLICSLLVYLKNNVDLENARISKKAAKLGIINSFVKYSNFFIMGKFGTGDALHDPGRAKDPNRRRLSPQEVIEKIKVLTKDSNGKVSYKDVRKSIPSVVDNYRSVEISYK